MQKVRKRKGFGLTEILIVIAIIAVLSTITVIGYLSSVNTAQENIDKTLLKQLNTLLLGEATLTGANKTAHEAVQDCAKNGFDSNKLTFSTDDELLWDSKNDCFVYLEKGSKSPEYIGANKRIDTYPSDYFKIFNSRSKFDESLSNDFGYSIYLGEGALNSEGSADLNVLLLTSKGIDVGDYKYLDIFYDNQSGSAQEVIFRTNSTFTTLTVNAFVNDVECDTIRHYGVLGTLVVNDCGYSSFHEHGKVFCSTVSKGKIVVENDAELKYVEVKSTAAEIINNGTIKYGYANDAGYMENNTQVNWSAYSAETYLDVSNVALEIAQIAEITGKYPLKIADYDKDVFSVLCEEENVRPGEIVSFYVNVNSGYEIKNISVVGEDAIDVSTEKGYYFFSMPSAAVTICVTVETVEHVHNYGEILCSEALASGATCTEAEKYYYSCSCENGTFIDYTHTFTYGEALNHVYSEWSVLTDATCIDEGEEVRLCTRENCSHADSRKISANGHDFKEINAEIESTCNSSGHLAYKDCAKCEKHFAPGASEFEKESIVDLNIAIDPENHEGKTILKNAKEATCTESGYTGDIFCESCGKQIASGVEIEIIEHAVGDWIVEKEASCSEVGSKYQKCTICNEIIKTVQISKTPHTEVIDNAVAATCTEMGLTEGKHCSVCNKVLIAQTITEALGHDYLTVKAEATCTKEGQINRKCSRCSDSSAEIIPVSDHMGEWKILCNATCAENGTKQQVCSNCNLVLNTETIFATGHFAETIVGTEATCLSVGKTDGSKCSVCGEILIAQEEIPMKDHSIVSIESTAPTCTEDGKSEGSYCSYCNTWIVEQKKVDKLGHDLTEHESKAATCSEVGWEAYETCSRCNYTTYEEISFKHIESEWQVTENATCTKEGIQQKICNLCGIVLQTEVIPLCAHSEEIISAVEATCTENGLTEGKKCSVCGVITEEQTEISAIGHTEVIDEYVAATCTIGGLTEGKHCSVCNLVLVQQKVIASKGHIEVIIEAVAATCMKSGLTSGKKCSVCGVVTEEQAEISAIGHSWKITAYDETTHTESCENCNTESKQEHAFSVWKPVSATSHYKTCKCGQRVSDEHNFDNEKCSGCNFAQPSSAWQLVTDIDQLCEGDQIIIAYAEGRIVGGNGNANGEAVSNGVINCVKEAVFKNGQLSELPTGALVLVLKKDGESWRFCDVNGNELLVTSSRLSWGGDGSTWTISFSENEAVIQSGANSLYYYQRAINFALSDYKSDSMVLPQIYRKASAICTEHICGEMYWDEYTHWCLCAICGVVVTDTSHVIQVNAATEATCLETGLTESVSCSVCNYEIKKAQETAALGHDMQTDTDNPHLSKCSRCDKEVVSDCVDSDCDGECDICGNVVEPVTYKISVKLSLDGKDIDQCPDGVSLRWTSSDGEEANISVLNNGDKISLTVLTDTYTVKIDSEVVSSKTLTVVNEDILVIVELISKEAESEQWILVTDISQISEGDKVILAVKDLNVAMSAQGEKYRNSVDVEKNDYTLTLSEDIYVFEVKKGSLDNTWAFYDTSFCGYLSAPNESKNLLYTLAAIDANSSWQITVSQDGTASLVAGGSGYNTLRYYEKGNSRYFGCFENESGTYSVAIYKLSQ